MACPTLKMMLVLPRSWQENQTHEAAVNLLHQPEVQAFAPLEWLKFLRL